MQRFYDKVLDRFGNPAAGVSVSVVGAVDGSIPTLYLASDNALTPTHTIPNPFTTDSSGVVAFAAANGRYTISYSGSNITPQTQTWVSLSDGLSVGPWLFVEDYGARGDGTTDDTAAIQATINAVHAAGGGTVAFQPKTYLVLGQIVMPGNGATPPQMHPITLRGAGAFYAGESSSIYGGTVLDMRYNGSRAKLTTNGLGLLEITGITLYDQSGSSLPFVLTTNTTLHVHGNGFIGSKNATACDQDCIVLGGINQVAFSSSLDDGFQGYGTVINNNYFNRIRRAVYGRAFCNGCLIFGNTVWANAGSNLSGGAAIELDGQPPGGSSIGEWSVGNIIRDNLVEVYGYVYGVKLQNAANNTVSGNGFFDAGAGTVAGCRFESTAFSNNFDEGCTPAGKAPISDTYSGPFPNRYLVSTQGIYNQIGPTNFVDPNYPTKILFALMNPANGAQVPTVQPAVSFPDTTTVLKVLRSDAEGVNPGTTVLGMQQNGTLTLGGASAGTVNFQDAAGTLLAGITTAGRKWYANGVGGQMFQDSGTGGSYFDLRNYAVRFYDHNAGPLRALIGGGADQIRFGPNGLTDTGIIVGTNTPEGAVTAPVGSLFLRRNGGAATSLYVKESGTGNTGWVAK